MKIISKRLTTGLAALLLAAHAWAGGDSSDGHTHAAPTPPVVAPVVTATPRLSSQTDQFELVGVLHGNVLTLYLDLFASNAPVAKAQIELESGSWKATATEVSPAVYTVTADLLAQPGKHPVAITVQAGDVADLMDATLEVAQPSPAHAGAPPTRFWNKWALWLGAAVLAVAAMALLRVRRNKQQRQPNPQHTHL